MDIRIIPYYPQFPAKGSHLLKEFANTGTPILDSLIRESVQNSLDAAKEVRTPVKMDFVIGDFCKKDLFAMCDGLKKMIQPNFPDIPSRFLSFRDYNTEGLTGNVTDMGDQNTGNYFKLVLDIGNEQTDRGAGGSCGIGKSLYFRLGVKGFVIYYSRISIGRGKYESRLIAIMVENERSNDSVIPPAEKGMSKSGIAYWGVVDDDTILPVTDEDEIEEILDIFGMDPYRGDETGTMVILPFIDEEALLNDNRPIYEIAGSELEPVWMKSIDNFLRISVQRWYFARLNNIKYKHGCPLNVSVGGKRIKSEDMVPCFKIMQALYNRASGCKEDALNDILSDYEGVKTEDVLLGRYRPLERKKAGALSYVLADKNILGIMAPENCYPPYVYCDTDFEDNDTNVPLIGFCRKPGMVVSYETSGDWLYRVPDSADGEHFMIAMFVLNSNNCITGTDYDLEEYVRGMEPNDHMAWTDGTFKGQNYSFIKNIKSSVSKILYSELSINDQGESKRKMSELGKIFSWILPPEDFGRKASPRGSSGGGSTGTGTTRTSKKLKYTILSQSLKFDEVVITYGIESEKARKDFAIELLVSAADGKNISLSEWVGMGASAPFWITKAQVSFKNIDGKSNSKIYPLTSEKSSYKDMQTRFTAEMLQKDSSSVPCLLNFEFDEAHMFKMEVKITISISSRKALPVINIY